MKKIVYILLSVVLNFGCRNATKTGYANSNDSTNTVIKDATKNVLAEDNELTQIVEEYLQSYNSTFLIDTSYLFANDTIGISIKHECLMDNAVVIPKKYVGIYGLDSFVTHNFTSSIVLRKNHKIVDERHIGKDDFEKYLDTGLKKYGVLLYPSIKYFPDSIDINYSLSIPLTDIGVRVSAIIKDDSLFSFVQR